jgi:hypothetical protein
LIGRGRFDEAEKILRRIAVVNKRNFDRDAYQQVKDEQEKVCLILILLIISLLS